MILRRWLASVRTRRRGASADHELDDELRTHLEMAVDENLARGMSEREAARAAHRDLGVVSAVREAHHQADSLYWLDTLLQDVRYGVRILRRSPRFTVAVVLVLGIGVAMTTTVFAIVDSLLLNAVPFAEPHRLVELNRWGPSGGGPSQPVAMVENWRNEVALFERVETYGRVEGVFTGGGEPETLPGARVSPGMFPLLGIAPEVGRAFAPDEAASPVAVVSHAAWQTRFGGDAGIVGRPLRLGDRVLTIVGVMPASFRFPDADTTFWEPFEAGRPGPDGIGQPFVSVIARLAPNVSFELADARAAALAPQWNPRWASTGITTRLRSLNQLAGLGVDARIGWIQQRRGALFLLFGAVACVLLIACANAANLFLSRALSRSREFAIRAAAGATRPRLCRQLLTESVVVSALAGVVGLVLAAWLVGVAAAAVPPDLARRLLNPIDVDARVAAWAVLAALLAGLAATLPPALRTVGRDLVRPSQGRGPDAPGGHGRLRGGLVAVQNALAVVLLVGAFLMGRSLWTLLDVDVGWTAENAVALEPRLSGPGYQGPDARSRFLAELADLTASAPGVEAAAPADQVPLPVVRAANTFDEHAGTDGVRRLAQPIAQIGHVARRPQHDHVGLVQVELGRLERQEDLREVLAPIVERAPMPQVGDDAQDGPGLLAVGGGGRDPPSNRGPVREQRARRRLVDHRSSKSGRVVRVRRQAPCSQRDLDRLEIARQRAEHAGEDSLAAAAKARESGSVTEREVVHEPHRGHPRRGPQALDEGRVVGLVRGGVPVEGQHLHRDQPVRIEPEVDGGETGVAAQHQAGGGDQYHGEGHLGGDEGLAAAPRQRRAGLAPPAREGGPDPHPRQTHRRREPEEQHRRHEQRHGGSEHPEVERDRRVGRQRHRDVRDDGVEGQPRQEDAAPAPG